MSRVRRHLNYSNVVSTICLFILLGGGAYAATKLPRNSVGPKQLKKNAVTGIKVADGSLSAADIKGPVGSAAEAAHAAAATHAATADAATDAGHAATADQATNAGQLGGASPASFFPSAKVKRVDQEVEVTTGNHDFPLLTMGPLTLEMSCNKGASLTIGIQASSSAPGASVYVGFESSQPSSSGQIFPVSGGSVLVRTDSTTGEAGSGQLVYRDDNTSIVMPFGYFVSNLFDECRVSGVALQS